MCNEIAHWPFRAFLCAEKSGKQHWRSYPPLQANTQPTTVSIQTACTLQVLGFIWNQSRLLYQMCLWHVVCLLLKVNLTFVFNSWASKISVVSIIGSLVMLLFKTNKQTNYSIKSLPLALACSCVLDDTLFGTHSQWKDLMSGEEGVGLELVVSDVSDT